MNNQLSLLPEPPKPPKPPRAKPRKLMHWIDISEQDVEAGEYLALFECKRCGHESEWLKCSTDEVRRGIPCPECNKSTGDELK